MAVVNFRHVTGTGKDGAGSPLSFALTPGPMDFECDELEADNEEAIPVYSAGVFLELVPGQQKAYAWSLTLLHEGKLVDNSTGKPMNLALKKGTWSAATTGDPGALVWTLKTLELVANRAGISSTMTFRNSRVKIGFAAGQDGNKLKLSGVAYGLGSGAGNEAFSVS
jgi:hypothetical protein